MPIFYQIITNGRQFAQKLETEIKLNLNEQVSKMYEKQEQKNKFPAYLRDLSSLTLVTDSRLVKVLMEKILLSMSAIAYTSKSNLVEVELGSLEGNIQFVTKIKLHEEDEKVKQLLEINNGNFEIMDHLPLSSGLESYIISTTAGLLNSSITTDYNKYNSTLTLSVLFLTHPDKSN